MSHLSENDFHLIVSIALLALLISKVRKKNSFSFTQEYYFRLSNSKLCVACHFPVIICELY